MEDLERELPGGPVSALAPTSQSSAGVPHENRAVTAPGGESMSGETILGDERAVQPAPEIDARDYDGRQLEHGEGEGAAGSWSTVSGQSWGPGG